MLDFRGAVVELLMDLCIHSFERANNRSALRIRFVPANTDFGQ